MNNCYLCNKSGCERVFYPGEFLKCCPEEKTFLCIKCDEYWSSSSKRLDELKIKIELLHNKEYHYPVDLV